MPELAYTLPAATFPVTLKLDNVPTLVILGCAAVVTVPAVVADDTVPDTLAPATALAVVANDTAPVTLAPAIALNPLPLPVNTPVLAVMLAAVIVPLTPNDVSVPTLVILGCADVVTVPAVVALVAAPDRAPTNVVAVIELFDKLAMRPVLVSSVILPVAAFAKRRKLFPVPAATLMKSATFA